MPALMLTPKSLNSEKWRQTRHAGPCIVIAPHEQAARSAASNAFYPLLGKPTHYPWTDADLVSVAITKAPNSKGTVFVQRQNGEFVPFTEESSDDDLTPVRASPGILEMGLGAGLFGGGTWESMTPGDSPTRAAGGVTMLDGGPLSSDAVYGVVSTSGAPSATASEEPDRFEAHGTISNPPAVKRVLQNRQLIVLHTTGLLGLLDDFCKAGDGNIQRPQFWFDDDPSSEQLRDLLSSLRDELRQLNGLLRSQKSPDHALLQKALGLVGSVGTNYLTEAAKSLGKWTGTGVFFSIMLGDLLVDVDAMSVKSLWEIIAKLSGE